jgi:hypothetical protein
MEFGICLTVLNTQSRLIQEAVGNLIQNNRTIIVGYMNFHL